LSQYLGFKDREQLWQRCCKSSLTMKQEWEHGIDEHDRKAVEKFYDDSQGMMDELVWWHTLESDVSPLAYVVALEFAQQHPGRAYLDFGSGIGSGGILFGSYGFDVSVADISPSLLRFNHWRFALRKLPACIFDTSTTSLPQNSFDFITAMDVFEHLFDPVETATMLWTTLKPGGFLFGRFGVEENEDKPQHIVKDFGPMFERLKKLGMNEVWQDEWLWGHQAFQKT
jgi:2-polyprenyl-3-methyl-5-hydroxy-6-metoxy-1,4-benzoquinol methylase